MQQLRGSQDVDVNAFLRDGLDVKTHLTRYLTLSLEELEKLLPKSMDNLAALHPGPLRSKDATEFYENTVGTGHLLELAAWHLSSSDYIADTLRLQGMMARGQVLDFGGGIGTHALSAATLPEVDHVWFVDLNPHNQAFVQQRAQALGLSHKLSVHRDLHSTADMCFDTVVCLDVLEHLPNPSAQLLEFHQRMAPDAIALLNWYFFKGYNGEYPFHFDDSALVNCFFRTLQGQFLELFHPLLITARLYGKV
ncbi:class I SAM-dependent methyltransferase [Synechococcus sp. M16CYN]|uniref:class I SAM-dependent methyltransferase n=1 Tax=Synechococcus sp. M16CYN TaxID=3103139 RepID=UPI00324A5F4E